MQTTTLTDDEVKRYAREFVIDIIADMTALDVRDWWEDNEITEYYYESDFEKVIEFIRSSKIILKQGR